jgi:hydroxypyruvate isomerase
MLRKNKNSSSTSDKMNRQNFIKNTCLTGISLTSISSVNASIKAISSDVEVPFQLNYAFHDGMFISHAGKDFCEQIKFGYDHGFRAIEDNGMMDRTVAEQENICKLIHDLKMQMGVFVLNFDHWPVKTSLTSGNKEWRDKFIKACNEAIDVAKRCNAKWITVVPGNFDNNLPMDVQTANVIDTLRYGCDILEKHGLVMVLEALSDTSDLFLRHSAQSYLICKAVNRNSCKILFDMYHMQRNEGNIINNLENYWDEIVYLQIGDNPGRNEPGTGEMNYKNIFKYIKSKGYKGILGMEHGNSIKGKIGEEALIKAYEEADKF